jgi:hypothetical protein
LVTFQEKGTMHVSIMIFGWKKYEWSSFENMAVFGAVGTLLVSFSITH